MPGADRAGADPVVMPPETRRYAGRCIALAGRHSDSDQLPWGIVRNSSKSSRFFRADGISCFDKLWMPTFQGLDVKHAASAGSAPRSNKRIPASQRTPNSITAHFVLTHACMPTRLTQMLRTRLWSSSLPPIAAPLGSLLVFLSGCSCSDDPDPKSTCDDNNECTIDSVVPGSKPRSCGHEPVEPGTSCTIRKGGCGSAPGQCGGGKSLGVCVETTVTAWCDDNLPCTEDLCIEDPAKPGSYECSHEIKNAGAVCPASDACLVAACDDTGVCKETIAPAGQLCAPGVLCAAAPRCDGISPSCPSTALSNTCEDSLDRGAATSVGDATAFLYEPAEGDPIQRGVAPGTIERHRAGVVRGRVTVAGGIVAPGIKVSINQRPEYGYTYTRSDGMFDLAVNGGEEHG